MKRVSSTKSVMRFSVGPRFVGKIGNDADGDCTLLFVEAYEQFALDTRMELLVLGNGERRACCNWAFEDKRTLFLYRIDR